MFTVLPDRAESFKMRNFYRNLKMSAVNSMFPGSQRNTTSRDAKAFSESINFSQSTNVNDLTNSLMAGIATAGE